MTRLVCDPTETLAEHMAKPMRSEAEVRRGRFEAEATRDTKRAIAMNNALFGPIHAMLGGVK